MTLLLAILLAAAPPATRARPPLDHLLVIVFDQLRPDYLDRFDLPNLERLRQSSEDYTNAYLGYLGSETVVSHLVIPTGLPPKDLPWADDFFHDSAGLLGKPGAFYATGALTLDQLTLLMRTLPKETFLPYRLKQKLGGSVWAAGEKTYAALVFATPYSDSAITLKNESGHCVPYGSRVPAYIAQNDRFSVDCTKTYGSEGTYYPLDGAQFVPGDDPHHLGGDIWTADVALELMRHETWSGLFLTFGAIDKIGHMLGEEDASFTTPFHADYHLRDVAQVADAQLGRILDELGTSGLRDRTLIVVTSDHGGESSTTYLGNGKGGKWGSLSSGADPGAVPPALAELAKDPNIEFAFEDSAIRLWLKDARPDQRHATVQALERTPGVIEVYSLEKSSSGWHYRRAFSALEHQSPEARAWAISHDQQLVDSMANERAPHLVALLGDGVGFGLLGDHGGAQERVQRVPLFISVPGEPGRRIEEPFTTLQLNGLIRQKLGL